MIKQSNLKAMRSDIETFDLLREQVISQSRVVLTFSKRLIYATHRNTIAEISQLQKELNVATKKLWGTIKKDPKLLSIGMYSSAMQEYSEALCYLAFVQKKELPTHTKLKVSSEDYLGGLSDVTGEVGRRAVNMAIQKNYKEIERIHAFVEEVYGFFLTLNLRNSELRKKSDAIKWNLKKIEEVRYDIKK